MNRIKYIFEPTRLYLVWHHSGADSPRHRRTVGELVKQGDTVAFKYLKKGKDFQLAREEGFLGFPAFALTSTEKVHTDALDAFLTRLPPRRRADFKKYLDQYGLPADFDGSDMSLLGYTGARLASDSFELCPDYSDVEVPADLIIELSGARHHVQPGAEPQVGDSVDFFPEPENPYDTEAVAAICQGNKAGYVNKSMSKGFRKALESMSIKGEILKSEAGRDKMQILVLVACR